MSHKPTKTLCLSLLISLGSTVTTAEEIHLTKQWETVNELKQPESVVYNNQQELIYVSNVNGDPAAIDGNGFISIIAPDGNIQTLKWIDGLNAPKGMALLGNNLFVTDINELLIIDILKAKITRRYKADDQSFLNDVAINENGDVYVTDTASNRIYRLDKDKLEVWLEDERLENPNGLYINQNQIVVSSWGIPTEGWKTDIPGHILLISMLDKDIRDFSDGSPIGNLDGITPLSNKSFLVTDWMQGQLLQAFPDGKVKTLLELGQGSADFLLLESKNLLLIPQMLKGNVTTYSLNEANH